MSYNIYDEVAREAAHDYDPEPADRPSPDEYIETPAERRAREGRFPAPSTDGTYTPRTDLHIVYGVDEDVPF